MKTIITTEHGQTTVTDLVKIQETGKASLVKILHALRIPSTEWNTTTLQVTAFVVPSEDL